MSYPWQSGPQMPGPVEIAELSEFRAGTGTPVPGLPSPSDPQGHFISSIAVGQLLFIAPDPMLVERPKFHDLDARLPGLQPLREEIQRLFVAAKKRNLQAYSDYVSTLALDSRAVGILPPIKLYWPDRLALARSGGQPVLIVPFQTGLVAIDGETQLAAWHAAARRSPSVTAYHVDITVDHGKPVEWAKQGFHDLNVFGIKPNPTLAIFMDYRDPMNRIAKEIADEFFPHRVEAQQRQVSVRSDKLFTMAGLRLLVVCFAAGTAGIAHATRPMTLDDDDALRRGVKEWLTTLMDHLPGEGLSSRESIFTVPPMLAALGAAGHEGIDPGWFKDVSWRRDALTEDGDLVWNDIAGKRSRQSVTSDEGVEQPRLAVGGPKEFVHACFRALTASDSPEFMRVRMG